MNIAVDAKNRNLDPVDHKRKTSYFDAKLYIIGKLSYCKQVNILERRRRARNFWPLLLNFNKNPLYVLDGGSICTNVAAPLTLATRYSLANAIFSTLYSFHGGKIFRQNFFRAQFFEDW